MSKIQKFQSGQTVYTPLQYEDTVEIPALNIPSLTIVPRFSQPETEEDTEEPIQIPTNKRRGNVTYSRNDFKVGTKAQELIKLFEEHGVDAQVISGFRPNAKTKQGNISRHANPEIGAIDIIPHKGGSFDQIYKQILSSPEIVKWMEDNEYGILDETTPEMMKYTGTNIKHFHIGQDSGARRQFSEVLNKWRGGIQYGQKGLKLRQMGRNPLLKVVKNPLSDEERRQKAKDEQDRIREKRLAQEKAREVPPEEKPPIPVQETIVEPPEEKPPIPVQETIVEQPVVEEKPYEGRSDIAIGFWNRNPQDRKPFLSFYRNYVSKRYRDNRDDGKDVIPVVTDIFQHDNIMSNYNVRNYKGIGLKKNKDAHEIDFKPLLFRIPYYEYGDIDTKTTQHYNAATEADIYSNAILSKYLVSTRPDYSGDISKHKFTSADLKKYNRELKGLRKSIETPYYFKSLIPDLVPVKSSKSPNKIMLDILNSPYVQNNNQQEEIQYAQKGKKLELLNQANEQNPNFIQRLNDPNRKVIPYTFEKNGWTYDGIKTHLMTHDKGTIFPMIQEVDGELKEFTDWNEAKNNAIKNNDVVVTSPRLAKWFTKNYKNYYPKFQGGGILKIRKYQAGQTVYTPLIYEQSPENLISQQFIQPVQPSVPEVTGYQPHLLSFAPSIEEQEVSKLPQVDIYKKFQNSSMQDYIQTLYPLFQQALKEKGIENPDLAMWMTKQSGLESEYGKKPRGSKGYNLGGIKHFGDSRYDFTVAEDNQKYVDFENLADYVNYKTNLLVDKYHVAEAINEDDFIDRLQGKNPEKRRYSASENYKKNIKNMLTFDRTFKQLYA